MQVTGEGLERVAPDTQFLRGFLVNEDIYRYVLHGVPGLDTLIVNGSTSFLDVVGVAGVDRLYDTHRYDKESFGIFAFQEPLTTHGAMSGS